MLPRRRLFAALCLVFLSGFIYWKSLICFPGEPSVTSWGAPIVWAGMFNPEEDDRTHREKGTVIGLSVFAVGNYLPRYLLPFLLSADRHFMPGLPVVLYVLTDRPASVPAAPLRPGLSLVTLRVPSRPRWQDVSMLRMKDLQDLVIPLAWDQVDYLFCMDVDQVFTSRYGPETLGNLVAQLHSGYYLKKRDDFPYDTNPLSAAFMPPGLGQYYFHAAVFAGTPARIANLTSSCLSAILMDKEKGVEAIWQDESHLNRYLARNVPSKVLSPEYCWDGRLWLKRHRLRWAEKDYGKLREAADMVTVR